MYGVHAGDRGSVFTMMFTGVVRQTFYGTRSPPLLPLSFLIRAISAFTAASFILALDRA